MRVLLSTVVLLLVFTNPVWPWEGTVVRTVDGDTLTVLRDRGQVKVRVYGIDAPERRQPWGDRARQTMGELAHGRVVEVHEMDHDRYGRTVARVEARGIDVGAEMIRRGMAWVYDRYCTAEACRGMREDEARARSARIGLWADTNPVQPWEWRRAAK